MKSKSLGVWFSTNAMTADEAAALATGVEDLGYDTLWYPESLAYEAMSLAAFLLGRTSRLKVASGIANVYARDALTAAAGHDGLNRLYGDRFVLGLGVSHVPLVEGRRKHDYIGPLAKMRSYLADIADAGLERGFRRDDRSIVLAALGPKMLELAGTAAKGALPYNVTPRHTAMAREILPPDAWLCVEQKICLTTDASAARAAAAQQMARYMPLPNYRNSWLREGFSEDELAGQGSDRFLDAMVAWGDEAAVRARIDEHFAAGATHVCLQPFRPDGGAGPDWDALKTFAPG